MIQWCKRSLASLLGNKKDIVKNWPIVRSFNQRANLDLDSKRQKLLKENFREILNIVYSNYNEMNLWLDFGTLLGFYRENGIISHDLDMDFGVLIDNENEWLKFEEYLMSNGLVKTKEFYHSEKLIESSYSYNGLNVDFIVYRNKENKIMTETIYFLINAFGAVSRKETYYYELEFSGLKEVDFMDCKVKIPINTEEYLKSLYGENFREPTTNYDWKKNSIYRKISSDESKVILK